MERPSEVTTPEGRSPLGPLKAFLVLLAFFGAQLVAGLVIGMAGGIWFMVKRGDTGPAVIAEAQRAVVMPAMVVGLAVGGLVALGVTWFIFRGSRPPRLRSLGWSSASRRDMLVAGLAGVGLAVFYLFGLVSHIPPDPGRRWGFMVQTASSGGWPRHLWAALALAIAPPVEEFVFRGVLFTGLSRSWSVGASGMLVTLLFVATHLTEAWGYAPAIVCITAVGTAALIARILTKSLAPAVALHAGYNLVLVVSVYAGVA
jgi:membrane protease YdiL (CAAX protease family)